LKWNEEKGKTNRKVSDTCGTVKDGPTVAILEIKVVGKVLKSNRENTVCIQKLPVQKTLMETQNALNIFFHPFAIRFRRPELEDRLVFVFHATKGRNTETRNRNNVEGSMILGVFEIFESLHLQQIVHVLEEVLNVCFALCVWIFFLLDELDVVEDGAEIRTERKTKLFEGVSDKQTDKQTDNKSKHSRIRRRRPLIQSKTREFLDRWCSLRFRAENRAV